MKELRMGRINTFSVRAATEPERMYTFESGTQISAQAGLIGYLRADFGSTGKMFYSTWNDFDKERNTEEFSAEFDDVINWLRSRDNADGFLRGRSEMESYCMKHDEAAFHDSFDYYGFRVDSEKYAYIMRITPRQGVYNLYCHCYIKEHLDWHLTNAEKGIRFIDPAYNDLFWIRDGGKIRITFENGSSKERTCRYIDPCHFEIVSEVRNLYHICEFAEKMERIGATVTKVE